MASGFGWSKKKASTALLSVRTQLLPGVGLGKDALAGRLGGVAAVLLLGYLEDDLAHRGTLHRTVGA